MYLINDAVSNFRNEVYAKKGDWVTVISINEPAVIVEDKEGERFPTILNNLSESPVKPSFEKVMIIEAANRKKTKTKLSPQQNLF